MDLYLHPPLRLQVTVINYARNYFTFYLIFLLILLQIDSIACGLIPRYCGHLIGDFWMGDQPIYNCSREKRRRILNADVQLRGYVCWEWAAER
jgi:hypothetical protein